MKQHDNSEAMRLADYARGDEYQRAAEDAVDLLRKQSAQIAELEAERDQHQHTATSLLSLLADIRKACGDNGKRMQPELVEFIGAMSTERDQLRAEVERLTKTDAEILACNYPDGEENGPTISAPDYELISFARQLGIRDHARTTHKD